MIYDRPQFKARYDNFIDGQYVPPVDGRYFEDYSPIDGKPFCEVARSNEKDVERALDAAHKAAATWNHTSAAERSNILLKIAQVTEDHLEYLARVETVDNGKPIRETRDVDAQRSLAELGGGEGTPQLGSQGNMALPGPDENYDQQLNQIKGMIAEDPGRVAQVVRTWVASD